MTSPTDTVHVVGITGDIAYGGPRFGATPTAFVPCLERYQPFRSSYAASVFIRTPRSPDDVEREFRQVVERRGAQYVLDADTSANHLAWSLRDERLLATISGTSGTLIVLLTAAALYAFCSYVLMLRRHELAIRSALGASARQLGLAVLGEASTVLAIGSLLGAASTWLVQRALAQAVVGIAAPGTIELLVALGTMSLVTLAAVTMPTVRATRPNLAQTLRSD
jgi:putative ABC transport system permease protein